MICKKRLCLLFLSTSLVSCFVVRDVSAQGYLRTSRYTAPVQWTQAVRITLNRDATAQTPKAKYLAIRDLIGLHDELMNEPRLKTSPTVQRNEARVRVRLRNIQKQLKQHMQPLAQRGVGRGQAGRQVARQGVRGGDANVAAVARDYGQELLELIERTINPAAWQVNGGSSTIFYYQPGNALVITGPMEVHEQTANLLYQLRAAGGP